MKCTILFTVLLSATVGSAQNTGVNTMIPLYPLHVVGNTSNNLVMMIESEHPQATRLVLKNSFPGTSMTPTAGIAYQLGTSFVADNYVTKDHKWILNTYPVTGPPVIGAITSDAASGYTGINTVAPSFRLHVKENQGENVCIYGESNSPDFATIAIDTRNNFSESGFLIARQGFQKAYMGINISNDWYLHVSGVSNALYVKDSVGFVGINKNNPTASLDVNGNGKFAGDISVQNGKGIVRSNGATQQKIVTTIIPFNQNMAAGQTVSFNINWSESFSSPPSAFVGNITSGGGFAEVIISFSVTTANGATVWIYNPKNSNVNPNFSFTAIAIGAQ
jgi:hypothetical protein